MTTGPDLNEALPVDTSGVGEADDVLFALGGVERRLHARAYHHWASLLGDAPYPPIAALDPEAIADFAGNSVLLDFRGRSGDPAIAYIGQALRGEGDLDGRPGTLADLPQGSLLARMVGHYGQILSDKAPAGFEAEFVNARGRTTLYRAILLPYSSDGRTIDFIHGVVSWKELADPLLQATLDSALLDSMAQAEPPATGEALWDEAPEPPMRRARADPAPLGHVAFDTGAAVGSPVVLVGRVTQGGRIAVLGSVVDNERLADRVLRASQ